MNFREYLKDNLVILDGGMGTLLQSRGLAPGEYPERWNTEHADVVTEIHRMYYDAGSNVVCSNTFGANSFKFSDEELDRIVEAAMENAKRARSLSGGNHEKYIALDIGPTGKMLKPLGDLDFEDAVSVFAKTVKLGVKYGADLVIVETMSDSYETKAALLAVKENCDLPVIVTNSYGEDGKLMTGASADAMVAMLEGMGADAVGANCSLGPKQLGAIAELLLATASVPVVLKPNAGMPKSVDGKTVYDVDAVGFSAEIKRLVEKGVRVTGGCCGTTPEYIKNVSEALKGVRPVPVTAKNLTVVSSYSHTVKFGKEPVLIGERINPTGKKRFKQALLENDMNYIVSEGISQQEKGVHILDVNVGLPGIDEPGVLKEAVCRLQTVTDLPLQIDTSDASAMEAALRRYNGKAMINSVSGKEESMQAVFPLAKKYGGVIVALTLDDNGIPETAEERVQIARKILETAGRYGISRNDIVFDTLAMPVSADIDAANVTLEALRRIKEELGCNTSLGVSNVSFGIPNRDAVNSVFYLMALEKGLSAAIMNPYSAEMMKTYYTYKALKGMDENCSEYIATADMFAPVKGVEPVKAAADNGDYKTELQYAIVKGLRERAEELTGELLKASEPLDIVNGEIIPALDIVGKGFEEKRFYLPQLLMSAEAAKGAFEQIKRKMLSEGTSEKADTIFVIATVKGDIHDIGKNIVKLLLENYGYNVIDLGKDVAPEIIVSEVVSRHAHIAGLSALMTTTVPAMEETIKQLRVSAPWCKVIVGGAVLTQEYADKIGADKYAKDAMEAVRYAGQL